MWQILTELWRERRQSQRCPVVADGATFWRVTSKPQPRGNTQINRNGLINKREPASNMPESLAKQL